MKPLLDAFCTTLSCRTAAVRWWAVDELGCQAVCDSGGSGFSSDLAFTEVSFTVEAGHGHGDIGVARHAVRWSRPLHA